VPKTPSPAPEDRTLVTVKDAATLLSVSVSTVYRLIRDGEVSIVRMGQSGRSIRVTTESIRDHVTRNARTYGG
jgi:excisionase family DNA binding protein